MVAFAGGSSRRKKLDPLRLTTAADVRPTFAQHPAVLLDQRPPAGGSRTHLSGSRPAQRSAWARDPQNSSAHRHRSRLVFPTEKASTHVSIATDLLRRCTATSATRSHCTVNNTQRIVNGTPATEGVQNVQAGLRCDSFSARLTLSSRLTSTSTGSPEKEGLLIGFMP
jgi:hypothetical protein